MAIITIFGMAGTGKSTCGKMLARKLGYEFVSTGNLFREMAKDQGLSLEEFEKKVTGNPDIDKEFDKKIEQLGKEKDNFIIESRLAWYFIPHSFKVKFFCADDVRVARVASRERLSFDEAKEKTLFREKLHAERYARIYGIEDYTSGAHFDYCIDTSRISPNEITDEIIKEFSKK